MKRGLLIIFVAALLLACQRPTPGVGSVNGRTVSQAEFDNYLAFRQIGTNDEKRRADALEEYLRREALAGVIERQGVPDKNLLAAEVNEFRKERLISRYFDDFLRQAVSEEVVHSYYTTHAGEFQERRAHVSHIIVRTREYMREAERMAKKAKIEEAYSRLVSGEDFTRVATQYSEDPAASRKGGDLGWLTEGAIDPLFSDKIFSAQPNEPTEPFENDSGFHIVMVTEGPEMFNRAFAAVKGSIETKLRGEAYQAELARLLGQTQIESR